MATDIITLGIGVDSSGAVTASRNLDGLATSGGRAENATNSLSSAFNNLNKYMMAAAAAFGIGMGISGFISQIRSAIAAIDDLKIATIQIAAQITTMQGPKNVAEHYKEATVYANALAIKLQEVDAKSFANYDTLLKMVSTMAMQGVLLDVNNKKQVDSFTALSNAVAMYTVGQNQSMQAHQEIRALMSGEVRQGAQLAIQIDGLAKSSGLYKNGLKDIVAEGEKHGDTLERLAPFLTGINAASGDIATTWTAVSSSMDTAIAAVRRAGFDTIFQEAVRQAGQLVEYLKEHADIIGNRIQQGWLAVRGVLESIRSLIISFKEPLEIVGGLTSMVVRGWALLATAVFPPLFVRVSEFIKAMWETVKLIGNIASMAAKISIGDYGGAAEAWNAAKTNFKQGGVQVGKAFKSGFLDEVATRSNEFLALDNIKKTAASKVSVPILPKGASGKTDGSSGGADPYAQARYDKQVLDSEAAIKKQYMENARRAEEAALKDRLVQLSYEKDMGLKTTQQYLDEKYALQRASQQKELDAANAQSTEMYQKYSDIWDKSGSDAVLTNNARKEYVKTLGDAEKIVQTMNAETNQKPRDEAIAARDAAKQYLSAEQALLSATGQTYAATVKQIEIDQQSRIHMDEKTKAVLEQVDAIKKQKAAYDELNAVNAVKNQTEDIKISMIADPYEQQRASMEAKYAREKELLEQQLSMSKQGSDLEAAQSAQLAAIQIKYAEDVKKSRIEESKTAWDTTMAYAKKAVPQFAMFDKLIAASQKDFAVKGKDGVVDQTKSNLAMYSAFAGAATDIFSGLAEQQDKSSREGFEAAKNYSYAAAVMNTAAGIMNAFATSSNIYAGVAMAAVVAAAGVIQIAKISSTSYGGGGTVSVPSGTTAGAGANGGGVAGSAIGERYISISDSQSAESLQKLADSADNASLAIGKIVNGFSKIADMFSEGGYASMFMGNAYGINGSTGLGSGGSNMPKIFQDSGLKNKIFAVGDILGSFVGGGGMGLTTKINDAIAGALFGIGNVFKYKGSTMLLGGSSSSAWAIDADEYHRKGGLFGGGATKYEMKFDAEWSKFLEGLVKTMTTSINRMAITMGTNANMAGVTLPTAIIQTFGRTSDQISKDVQKWLENVAARLAKTVPELEKYAFAGENYYLALTRLNDALVSTNQQFQLIGVTLIESSLKGANQAYKLQDLMGGSEKFATKIDNYFTGMYTDEQQAALKAVQAATQVKSAFAEMGLAAPTTRAQFIALVQSLDVSTEAGAKTFAALMDVSSAFVTMTGQAEKVAKAQTDLNQDVTSRTYRVKGQTDMADIYDLSIQQAKELADAQEMGLDVSGLLTVQALEMAKALKTASETFSEAQQKLIDTARTALEDTISYQTAAANAIKSILTDPSNVSPEKAYQQAQTAFATTKPEGLPNAATALLNASKAYYGSSAAYQTDLQSVLDKLGTVAGIGTNPTLDAANKQIDKLEDIRKLLDANDTRALAAYQTNTELGVMIAAFLVANQSAIAANLAALHNLGIPGYATGTAYVPHDMTANIHQGEIIMDRASSDVLRKYGIPANGRADNKEELAELKEQNQLLRAVVAKLTDIESPLRRVASR